MINKQLRRRSSFPDLLQLSYSRIPLLNTHSILHLGLVPLVVPSRLIQWLIDALDALGVIHIHYPLHLDVVQLLVL